MEMFDLFVSTQESILVVVLVYTCFVFNIEFI